MITRMVTIKMSGMILVEALAASLSIVLIGQVTNLVLGSGNVCSVRKFNIQIVCQLQGTKPEFEKITPE